MRRSKLLKSKTAQLGLLLIGQVVLFSALSLSEAAVGHFADFFHWQKGGHQRLFCGVPFSVGDALYFLCGFFLAICSVLLFLKKYRRSAISAILVFANAAYFLYTIFWGMLYYQKPIAEIGDARSPPTSLLKNLAEKYLETCKRDREKVKESVSGTMEIRDIEELKSEIILRQFFLKEDLQQKNTGIISIKPSLFRGIMSSTGILGYYNPFTGEAQYDPEMPHTMLAATLPHEAAHQLGYAREQEASFIGFLCGKDSQNAELRYASGYFALKSLLNALADEEPEFVLNILSRYSPGMQRDRLAEIEFRERNQGPIAQFFGFTNDFFLKSNRQDGSISYSYFVYLLVGYESDQ